MFNFKYNFAMIEMTAILMNKILIYLINTNYGFKILYK
jgi:hypothetical protein